MPINEICILKNIPNDHKMIKSVRVKCCGLYFSVTQPFDFSFVVVFVSWVYFTLFKMCIVCLLSSFKCFILRKHLCEYLIIQIRIRNNDKKLTYLSRLDIYENVSVTYVTLVP